MQSNQMNGLYPIIRRVRRPLLPLEPLRAASAADAKPVTVAVVVKPQPATEGSSVEQESSGQAGASETGE
jgi:hypothetical protein